MNENYLVEWLTVNNYLKKYRLRITELKTELMINLSIWQAFRIINHQKFL